MAIPTEMPTMVPVEMLVPTASELSVTSVLDEAVVCCDDTDEPSSLRGAPVSSCRTTLAMDVGATWDCQLEPPGRSGTSNKLSLKQL
jgi:hypothetical protein